MISITFPEPSFRTKNEEGKDYIFDSLRKKWLLLTPEEWVRQNFVNYLINTLLYPASLIAVEKEINLGELKKRFDLLVYDNDHHPWMIIECKADSVVLGRETLEQVLRYNISVPAEYIVITNGSNTYGWKKVNGKLEKLEKLPPWE